MRNKMYPIIGISGSILIDEGVCFLDMKERM